MPLARPTPARRFTLLEVMCALAVTALLMVTVMGVLRLTVRGIQRSRVALRRARISYGLARIVRRDVEALVAVRDEESPPLVVRSELPEGGGAVLELTTTSILPRAHGETDLQRVRYVLEPRPEATEGYEFSRQQTPYVRGSSPSWEHAAAQRLLEEVAFVRVTCWDGSRWLDGWAGKAPPAAVRMEVRLKGEEGADRYATWTVVPLADMGANPLPYLPPEATQE